MAHSLWIVPLVLFIAFLSSPRFRGDIAQTRVRRILASGLEKSRYTVFNDITFPSGGGTAHIDHLIVSRLGIFVIESLYVRGSVSGGEFQERWKSTLWGRTTRIDNPVHRNALQVEALKNILKIPVGILHPVVVLAGNKGSQSTLPEGVLAPEKLLAYIRKKSQQVLDAEQAERVTKNIDTARISPVGGVRVRSWRLLQLALIIVLLAGIWFAFHESITGFQSSLGEQRKKEMAPELFRSDGTPKTEREIWENSLVCAYSTDSGRCACYEPDGSKADLDSEKCRSLAERGSVLKQ